MNRKVKLAPESIYSGRRVALLTKHFKERVIQPVLHEALGCIVETIRDFDTDSFGTFTREIPRENTQLQVARNKARSGMEISGLSLGLASEGSFGPDPMVGLIPWNLEILVFLDTENELEVVGSAQGKANFAYLLTDNVEEAQAFAQSVKFPINHLVIRPESEHDSRIKKGIDTEYDLAKALTWAFSESSNGMIFMETDVRAHANPMRMAIIKQAAEDLAVRLSSLCPKCMAPGYWITQKSGKLPCSICGAPTSEPKTDVYKCLKCNHTESRHVDDHVRADPGKCQLCNP